MSHDGRHRFITLFSRLLFYFIIIMLLPLALLSLYFFAGGRRALVDSLRNRAEIAVARDGRIVSSLIEAYRHKGYLISTSPLIAEAIKEDGHIPESVEVYEALFSIMKGDVYAASALAVSASGNVRFSTHAFPEQYDLRRRQHDRSPFFNLSRASSETASLITIENRYTTEKNAVAVVSILRRIRSEEGNLEGYAVVDIFMDAFSPLNRDFIFSDMVLIEKDSFIAGSLLYDHFGSFARFPELEALEAPYNKASYVKNGIIAAVCPIDNTSLVLAGIVETFPHTQSLGEFLPIILGIVLIGIAAAVVLAWFLARSIAVPVGKLAKTMQSIEEGKLDINIDESDIVQMTRLDRSFSRIVAQIAYLLQIKSDAGGRETGGGLIDLPRNFGHHLVDGCVRFVAENYQKSVGLKEAAEALGVSESHLSRIFKEITGLNFMQYLNTYRINQAVVLIQDPKTNISELAYLSGFPTPTYFAKVFRHHTGLSPSRYRDRLKQDGQ